MPETPNSPVVRSSKTRNKKMTRRAIDMACLRRMKKQDEAVKLSNIDEPGKHHPLKRDGDETIILGLKSAVGTMAATKSILADGTFKCVLQGFSQLDISTLSWKTTSQSP